MSGGPSEVPLKELKIRVRFAAICRGAQARIANGEIPFWLKQMDADIERARRAASLTVNAHLPLQQLILGLDMACSEAPPAPSRTLRKELKQLVEAVERLRSKLDGVNSELQVEMLGAPNERCVDEETTAFEWPRDPLSELKGALDRFTEEARALAIPEGTAGPRQASTTMATDTRTCWASPKGSLSTTVIAEAAFPSLSSAGGSSIAARTSSVTCLPTASVRPQRPSGLEDDPNSERSRPAITRSPEPWTK